MQYKLRLIAFINLAFFYLNANSQVFNIQGQIIDTETQKPVEYASVSIISNSYVSTFTNVNGEFSLPSKKGDTLRVSCIGFKNRFIQVVNNASLLLIGLERDIRELEEVVVTADTSYKIVEKAFSLLNKNYSRKRYFREAFYREYAKKDDKYVRLVEAAVSEFDIGFDKNYEKQRIRVDQIRKSLDNIERSWQSKLGKILFGETNTLVVSKFNGDFLRRYSGMPKLFASDKNDFLNNYYFKLVGRTGFDDETILMIKIQTKPENDLGKFDGLIYINEADYGIVRFSFLQGAPHSFENSTDTDRRIYAEAYKISYDAYYQKYGDKYYLSRLKSVLPVNFDVLNSSSLSGYQFFHTDFITVGLYTNRLGLDKVKKREVEKRDIDLYNTNAVYDPNFWKSYPILKENPISHKALTDLKIDIYAGE